jgi:uncharacterized damage-inducible protein DinB
MDSWKDPMTFIEAYVAEFAHEMATTRALLSRVPEARADWRPHSKSRPLGELAQHIANLVGYAQLIVRHTEWDTSASGGGQPALAPFSSTAALLASFDANVASARAALAATTDAEMAVPWALKRGSAVIVALPRAVALRTFLLNHLVHHRGQLSVYLRLLDVPLPPVYGPTADEAR